MKKRFIFLLMMLLANISFSQKVVDYMSINNVITLNNDIIDSSDHQQTIVDYTVIYEIDIDSCMITIEDNSYNLSKTFKCHIQYQIDSEYSFNCTSMNDTFEIGMNTDEKYLIVLYGKDSTDYRFKDILTYDTEKCQDIGDNK